MCWWFAYVETAHTRIPAHEGVVAVIVPVEARAEGDGGSSVGAVAVIRSSSDDVRVASLPVAAGCGGRPCPFRASSAVYLVQGVVRWVRTEMMSVWRRPCLDSPREPTVAISSSRGRGRVTRVCPGRGARAFALRGERVGFDCGGDSRGSPSGCLMLPCRFGRGLGCEQVEAEAGESAGDSVKRRERRGSRARPRGRRTAVPAGPPPRLRPRAAIGSPGWARPAGPHRAELGAGH